MVYLCQAPKSNAVYRAYGEVLKDVEQTRNEPVPLHLRNAVTGLMKELGYGAGYAYDHDAPDVFSGQDYFPEARGRRAFYRPTDRGREAEIRGRLERWAELRRQRRGEAERS